MPSIAQYEAMTSAVLAGFYNPITLQSSAFMGVPSLDRDADVLEEDVSLGRTTFRTADWDLVATPRRLEINTYSNDYDFLATLVDGIVERRAFEPVVAFGVNRSVQIGGRGAWEALLSRTAPKIFENPLEGRPVQLKLDIGNEDLSFNSLLVLQDQSQFGPGARYQINNEFRFSGEDGETEGVAAVLAPAWSAVREHWTACVEQIEDLRRKLEES